MNDTLRAWLAGGQLVLALLQVLLALRARRYRKQAEAAAERAEELHRRIRG